jgi:hypothetical protein
VSCMFAVFIGCEKEDLELGFVKLILFVIGGKGIQEIRAYIEPRSQLTSLDNSI